MTWLDYRRCGYRVIASSSNDNPTHWSAHVSALVLLLCIAATVLLPLARAHLRYFYHEDDAHHFNRTVEMTQAGSLNPHYFNKPSLHFYLRMPAVLAGAAWARHKGELGTVKDIRTRDPYGLAGFALTPSHPTVLAAVRGASLLFTVGVLVCTYALTFHLSQRILPSLAAALLALTSPELFKNSYVVGVDVLMALLCLACSLSAARAGRSPTRLRLASCALLAGLACSAKYNAAPIVAVPGLLWLLGDRSLRALLTVAVMGTLGFLIGTPYAVITPDLFFAGLNYERWHYAVAGHEGHSAEPGLQQAQFYLEWLTATDLGWLVTGTALIPIAVAGVRRPTQRAVLVAVFPLAYMALMVTQKANFTRNMVTVVPYVAIAAILGAFWLCERFTRPLLKGCAGLVLTATLLYIPVTRSAQLFHAHLSHTDTRDAAIAAITRITATEPNVDIAVAGPLQLPIQTFALPGVDAFDPAKTSAAHLLQRGFTYLVLPTDQAARALTTDIGDIHTDLPGLPPPQRVPNNPAISIVRATTAAHLTAAAKAAPAHLEVTVAGDRLLPRCASPDEGYCWLTHRSTTIQAAPGIPTTGVELNWEVRTPWEAQQLTVAAADGRVLLQLPLPATQEWHRLAIPSAALTASSFPLQLVVPQVHAPASRSHSSDTRRLGVAVRAYAGAGDIPE
jgi:hypothetical protein